MATCKGLPVEAFWKSKGWSCRCSTDRPHVTLPNDGWHSKQSRWLLSKKAAADADTLGLPI
jgi:hypothetical protein